MSRELAPALHPTLESPWVSLIAPLLGQVFLRDGQLLAPRN